MCLTSHSLRVGKGQCSGAFALVLLQSSKAVNSELAAAVCRSSPLSLLLRKSATSPLTGEITLYRISLCFSNYSIVVLARLRFLFDLTSSTLTSAAVGTDTAMITPVCGLRPPL